MHGVGVFDTNGYVRTGVVSAFVLQVYTRFFVKVDIMREPKSSEMPAQASLNTTV